jgi:parallel beta-helix repeat protein
MRVKKYFADLLASPFPFGKKSSGVTIPQKASARPRPCLEAMEARLLFSAEITPLALSTSDLASPVVSDVQANQSLTVQSKTTELVVLDARVIDPAILIADIASQQSAGRAIEILEITENDNALNVIQNALAKLHEQGIEISAIHIVSHGRDAEFDLGNATINDAFLKLNASAFAAWSKSLTVDADILIYGCNVAQSTVGQSFARNLSALTGADVAENVTASGSALLGGDWSLEYTTGTIEATNIFTPSVEEQWNHLLATGISTPVYSHSTFTVDDMNTGTLVDSGADRTGGRAVAMDAAGNYVVLWTDSTTKALYFSRYAASGTLISQSVPVNNSGNDQKTPSIAMAADGSFVIVWSEKISGRFQVQAQRFNANGTNYNGVFTVGYSPSDDCLQPNVAINDNRDFVVVWQQVVGTELNNIYGHSYQWVSSGPPVSISTELPIALDPGGSLAGVQERPAVALLNNRVYLAWESQDTSSTGIYLRAFDLNGSNATTTVQVNTSQLNQQSAPDIAVAPDGRVIVVWQTDVAVATADSISYRMFEQSSSQPLQMVPVSVETVIATGHDESLPKVSVAKSGDFIVTYQALNETIVRPNSTTAIDNTSGIFFQGFDRNGVQTLTETSVTDIGGSTAFTDLNQYAVNVAWQGGTAIFAWTTEGSFIHTGNVVSRQFQINAPEILVSAPPANVLNVGGVSRPIKISLSSQPTSDVIVNITTSNSFGSVDISTLTFTSANWYLPRSVMVSAIDQTVRNSIELFNVQISPLTGSALEYRSIAPTNITFSNTNVAVTGIEVTTDLDFSDAPINSTLADLANYSGADGKISLREAILAANITPNLNASTPDLINFNIAGAPGALHTINLTSALPVITDRVTISGWSQSGTLSGQPRIIIDGQGGNYAGFTLVSDGTGLGMSSGTNIQGLGIQNFRKHGIDVLSSNNFIADNVITQIGWAGIHFWSPGNNSVTNNHLENNVISYSGYAGIHINGADNNYITGNVIRDNASDGVVISDNTGSGAINNLVQGNKIGGNGTNGVVVTGEFTSQNKLYNNHIGFDQSISALANTYNGILIENGASDNEIGGLALNSANFIAYNGQVGVRITGGNVGGLNSISNRVLGNSIFGNGSLGIDLTTFDASLGVFPVATHNPNDIGDPFYGPNGYINSPVLSAQPLPLECRASLGMYRQYLITSTGLNSFRVLARTAQAMVTVQRFSNLKT